GSALLNPADVQHGVFEVDLLPAQVHQLGGPQTMPEGQQDHGGVAMAPAVVPGSLNQPLDLALGQVLAGTIGGMGLRTGKATVRFTLAGPTTFRCRMAAISRPSLRQTAHIKAFLQQSIEARFTPESGHRDLFQAFGLLTKPK